MHELSLSQRLIDIVVEHARGHGLHRVTIVRVSVGALSCVQPEALTFCFDAVAKGTLADGAALSIAIVPVEAWCWTCQRTVHVTERDGVCPDCQNASVRAANPRDLQVTEIEGAGPVKPD